MKAEVYNIEHTRIYNYHVGRINDSIIRWIEIWFSFESRVTPDIEILDDSDFQHPELIRAIKRARRSAWEREKMWEQFHGR